MSAPPLWKRRPYLIGAIVFLIAFAAPFIAREGDFENVFIEASRRLLRGVDFYAIDETGFTYPPAFALLTLPLANAPTYFLRVFWYLCNAAFILGFWWGSWRLCGGAALGIGDKRSFFRPGWREHAVLWSGMLVGLRFVTDVLDHHQSDLLIAALVTLAGVVALERRWNAAATLAGLGAGLKATPLIFAPYFLVRRRLLAAVLVGVVAVAINLLPDLISRPPGGGLWLTRWITVTLAPYLGTKPAGQWFTTPVLNQSLAGTIYRLTNFAWPSSEQIFNPVKTEPILAPGAIKGIILASQLLTLFLGFGSIAAASLFRRRSAPAPAASEPVAADPPPIGLEFSIVMLMMVLVSPASSKPHFLIVLLPAYCLARRVLYRLDPASAALLGAAALLSLASHRGIAGAVIADSAQWFGAITCCAGALLIGCCGALLAQARASLRPATQTAPTRAMPLPSAASGRRAVREGE